MVGADSPDTGTRGAERLEAEQKVSGQRRAMGRVRRRRRSDRIVPWPTVDHLPPGAEWVRHASASLIPVDVRWLLWPRNSLA